MMVVGGQVGQPTWGPPSSHLSHRRPLLCWSRLHHSRPLRRRLFNPKCRLQTSPCVLRPCGPAPCCVSSKGVFTTPERWRVGLEQLIGLYGFMLLCIWNGGAIQTNVICSNTMVLILASAFPEPLLQPS